MSNAHVPDRFGVEFVHLLLVGQNDEMSVGNVIDMGNGEARCITHVASPITILIEFEYILHKSNRT